MRGFRFKTFSSFRPAIYTYHNPTVGVSISSNSIVSHLLLGILDNRPPQPKYIFINDIKKVIDFLTTLTHDGDFTVKNLGLKFFSSKGFKNITYLFKYLSGYIFNFDKNTKTNKKGKSANPKTLLPLKKIKTLLFAT